MVRIRQGMTGEDSVSVDCENLQVISRPSLRLSDHAVSVWKKKNLRGDIIL
jgi:hypothetical protein